MREIDTSSPITKEADFKASVADNLENMKITALTATRIDEIDVTNNCKNAVLTITSTILVTYLESTLENSDKGLVD